MWAVWWIWVVAGLILGCLEVVLPGFIFAGFAIGAVVTGLLLLVGVTVPLSALILIFAVVSLVAWVLLRRFTRPQPGQVKVWERDINDN